MAAIKDYMETMTPATDAPKSDARCRIPSGEPELPFVYLDWNIVQYLRKERDFDPILSAIVECRLQGAAILPYSIGHIMDATADWTRLQPQHRAERLRDMTFLDGLTSGWMWQFDRVENGPKHTMRCEAVVEACESRGRFTALRSEIDDLILKNLLDAKVAHMVEETAKSIHATLSDVQHLPPNLADEAVAVLRETFQDGLPEISDSGRNFMRMLGPFYKYMCAGMPSFDDAPPELAFARLEEHLRTHMPGVTLEKMWEMAKSFAPTLDRDDYFPGALGWFGYHRESSRNVRRAAPGYIADQSHARHALASAIFLTGEYSLSRRLEAWAAHTGRGKLHRQWPIVLQVTPTDSESIQFATEVVNAYTDTFAGSAHQFKETLSMNSAIG